MFLLAQKNKKKHNHETKNPKKRKAKKQTNKPLVFFSQVLAFLKAGHSQFTWELDWGRSTWGKFFLPLFFVLLDSNIASANILCVTIYLAVDFAFRVF